MKNGINQAVISAGGFAEFNRKFKEYSENMVYIDRNFKILKEAYKGKWIAVYRCNVLASAKEFICLDEKIKKLNLPYEEIVCHFIPTKIIPMILTAN